MRVLVAPLNADHRQEGQICAFRRVFGADHVVEFDHMRNGGRGFVEAVGSGRYDWVWMQLQDCGTIKGEQIRQAKAASPKTVFTHWMGDWRQRVSDYLAGVCAVADITFVSNDGQRELFEAAGAKRVQYLQIGLDWREDVLGEPAWRPPFRVPDVVLCGNYYSHVSFPGTAERLSSVLALRAAGIDAGVVGDGWPASANRVGSCHVKQQHHVWKLAKVALNINHANDCRLYYSDRQIIAMASGTPLVCRYIPGLEEEFVDGEHCVFFRTQAELLDKVRWLLGDAAARTRIGQQGRAIVMKEHSWQARVVKAASLVLQATG